MTQPPPEMPPRQERARATRESIVAAAAAEFDRNGYHASSLSLVLERSGVTKGALYFHFASKRDLALAVLVDMEAAYRDLVLRSANGATDPLRAAARLARDVQDLLGESAIARAGQRLTSEDVVGPDWFGWPAHFWTSIFAEHFARARDLGLVRPDVDPEALGKFVMDVSAGAFTNSLATGGLADLAERVRHNWELMFRSTATDEWLEGWHAEGGMVTVLGEHLGS